MSTFTACVLSPQSPSPSFLVHPPEMPIEYYFHAYLCLDFLSKSENIVCKVLPIRRHTIDLGRAFYIPSLGATHMHQHLCSVWAIFRTPFVPIEGGIDPLSLIDENIATCLGLRPLIQFVPASTHASLMKPSVFLFRLCGIHRRVICIAENVL